MKCRACKKEIVFVITLGMRFMPVDFDSLTETEIRYLQTTQDLQKNPLKFNNKTMRPHWATCTEPKKFRKKE